MTLTSQYPRPTLDQIAQGISREMRLRLPPADRLYWNNLAVIATMVAGGLHEVYGGLDQVALNVLPDQATGAILDRHATWRGVSRFTPRFAAGSVDMTGAEGSTIPLGTRVRRSDGIEYQTTGSSAAVVGPSGAITLPVIAREPGLDGNAPADVTVSFLSPPPGMVAAGVVSAGGMTGGDDTETDESLRARLRDVVRQPPAGGNAADWARWAREGGARRAWVTPLAPTLGHVTVRFVVPPDEANPYGIPSGAQVDDMLDYLNEVRPVTAVPVVLAPVAEPIAMTIQLAPNTLAVRDAVRAELASLFERESSPGGTILISRIREAVSISAGEADHVVVTPTANVAASAAGNLPVLGTITFAAIP